MEGWRDGEMERWRDGEMERWRDKEWCVELGCGVWGMVLRVWYLGVGV